MYEINFFSKICIQFIYINLFNKLIKIYYN